MFPSEWKKENIVPIYKKSDKQKLKIIVRFLYFRFVVKSLKDLFLKECFIISPLINSTLKTSPVSKPVIPVITNCYQLPAKSFDNGLQVRSVFLDISKAFDKKSDTKGLFLNWNKTTFLVNFFTSYLIF